MNNYFQNLLKETLQKVHSIESTEKDVLKRAFSTALALASANLKLKNFALDYEFKDEEEEIFFFKHQKPKLVSEYIYHCQVYNIEMNRPKGGSEAQRDYLNKELVNLQDYIERRPEFYSYYRLGSTNYDVHYFTRDKFELGRQYLEPTMSERDPKYSTNCDYKLAKLLANERLEIHLKSQLDEINHPFEDKAQLPWTTKKAFLIELIYALDSYRAFGKVPLKRVIAVAQKLFGIDLGNVSSIFAEMRLRNEPTPFLDALKEALLSRMKRSKGKSDK
ncbi:RteC domain-containing protein [Bacteroidales bacterium OttesenSCG-928-J19]|nr:RteC domain-containing protein [Bacteroidales bacterium OttesenSCG-928-J19]